MEPHPRDLPAAGLVVGRTMTALQGAVARGPLGRVWASIREPRHVKALYTLAFVAALGMGLSAVVHPPNSIEGVIGVTLTYVWGCFLILGGALGAATTIPGWWVLERLGIFAILVGVGIYAAVVLVLQIEQAGNRMPQWFALVSLALLWVPEIIRTWGHTFEPRG